jgi:transposase-like protein
MPAGRPTDYTEALAEEICLRLAEGESLVSICREEGMPGRATVFRWLQKYEAFRNQYARAKELMVESFAEEIIAIADDSSQDTITLPNGSQRPNREWIARAKLRVNMRQWLMAKLMPKKYGEPAAEEHSGPAAIPMTLEEFRKRALEAEQ